MEILRIVISGHVEGFEFVGISGRVGHAKNLLISGHAKVLFRNFWHKAGW